MKSMHGNSGWKLAAAALVCGLSASLAAAAVRQVSNFELGGRPVLVPSVQKMERGEGRVALPAEFTVRLPDGETLIAEQLAAALKRFPSVKVTPSAEPGKAFCRFLLTGEDVPKHDQGYRLSVTDSGIEIAARKSAGLFYGMQTLRNLLRNAEKAELPRLAIRDWPDFDRRGYFCKIRSLPPRRLPELKIALDAMAALKLNWLLLDTSETFPYQKYKLSRQKPERIYSLEQMREIADYARARHIEITPTMQIWSHSTWLRPHPDWEKMREGKRDDWGAQICPLNEQAREVVEQAITEQVRLYGTKLFAPLMDEIYSGPFHTCPRCKEVPPEKLLRDYVKFIEGVCRKLGVTMVVCQDALENRYWKYGDALRNAFDPATTRILWWNYDDNLKMVWNMPVFRKFRLVGHALNGKPLNLHNTAKLMRANGSRECTATYWYYSADGGVVSRLEWETPDSLGGFANSFDYLWHFTETHYADLDYDGTYEMMRLMYPEQVMAYPAGPAAPVPLEYAVNAELSGTGRYPIFTSDASTAALAKALAGLPERFRLLTSPGGKYYGIRLAGVPPKQGGRWCVEFGFGNRKAESLSFLLTGSIPTNRFDYGRCATPGRKRFRFEPAASIVLTYADKSREEAVLHYRREITDWNRPFGGMKMRFAVRGLDDRDQHFNFGICDFVNPHPEKPIAKISFSTRRLDGISPVMLAASARGLDKPFPKEKFDPAAVAKRAPAQTDPPLPVVRIRQDFENGIGDVKVSDFRLTTHSQFSAPIKAEVVVDPLSKTGNKALKVTVPPATNGGRGNRQGGGYLRVTVEMPYTIAPGTKSVTLRCRVSANALPGMSHINDYLIHKDLEHYWFQRVTPGTAWRTTSIPFVRAKSATKPYEDKTQTGLRRVSVFLFHVPETIELWFDDFGDSPDEVWLPWVLGDEAEPNG